MERVGEHPVPAGPLAVRWLAYELDEQRAGVATRARVRLENAGSAPWRSRGREGVQLAYHWLDPLGNAIVWDGTRTALPAMSSRPGETVELESTVLAPRPPGQLPPRVRPRRGVPLLVPGARIDAARLPVDVRPRIDERRLGVRMHGAARSRAGSRPRRAGGADRRRRRGRRRAPRSRRDPGTRLVAPAARRARGGLRARSEGRSTPSRDATAADSRPGRREAAGTRASASRFCCPSLLDGIEPETHEGLPAYAGATALFEGRAVVRLRSRSGRPSG